MSLLRTALRKTPRLSLAPAAIIHRATSKSYATHSSSTNTPTHRRVTVFNDTGRVNWGELSAREKAARTTQQTFNLALVIVGAALVCGVGYVLFADVFSPNSKTAHFNRAVTRVKASPACLDLLGPANSIKAIGESPWSSYARARQVGPTPMSQDITDPRTGIRTLRMRFMVEGKRSGGWVTIHMEQGPEDYELHYVLLALDVQGHSRVNLEGGPSRVATQKGKLGNIFGVSFR